MCGIAGVIHDSQDWTEAVERMTAALVHRGPDAGAVIRAGKAVLGARRLAVMDLTPEANQPMCDAARRYWVVFNGELYNFPDLRKELENRGHVFATQGDTEVLLHAFMEWGPECLQRFNGMFAFAIWDVAQERLFLARDRLGEKPLYYQKLPRGIAFASDLNSLRRHPLVSGDVNPRALSQYLSLNYVLSDAAIVRGVDKLPAAHYLFADSRSVGDPVPYWDLSRHFARKIHFSSLDEAEEATHGLLNDAVRIRLLSDVPLGAFLSGGLDSSSVAAEMVHNARQVSTVRTFSIGFTERGFSELSKARAAATYLGTLHSDQIVSADMAAALPEILRYVGEPFADTSVIPTFFLSRFARQHVTVSLSGDGGDESFAGYDTYVADCLLRAMRWLPAGLRTQAAAAAKRLPVRDFGKVPLSYRLRQFATGVGLDADRAHVHWRTIFTEEEKSALLKEEVREAVLHCDPFESFAPHARAAADLHHIDRALYVDIKTWLADDILVKVDRASMAHSLEVRTPFLDHRMVEFAAALPVALKLRGLRRKYILRRMQRHRLPRAVTKARKEGFNAPISHWLAGELRELARSVLNGKELRQWFRREAIDELWTDHLARRRDNGLKLFGLVALGLWMAERPS
jgi:asparagine synthase (glutamine-hydrolysing)